MTRGQRLAPLTPKERRAHETAEAILEGSGLRYQSGQIPGLAHILMAYADHEIQLSAAPPRIVREAMGLSDNIMVGPHHV